MVKSFRDLTVWQKALALAEHVYLASENFPKSEAFGLTPQMRRAVVSIPSNIAEGKAISGRAYLKHLRIALGSEAELQTQIEIATRLKMLNQSDAERLLNETSEVGRMLIGLLRSLSRGVRKSSNHLTT